MTAGRLLHDPFSQLNPLAQVDDIVLFLPRLKWTTSKTTSVHVRSGRQKNASERTVLRGVSLTHSTEGPVYPSSQAQLLVVALQSPCWHFGSQVPSGVSQLSEPQPSCDSKERHRTRTSEEMERTRGVRKDEVMCEGMGICLDGFVEGCGNTVKCYVQRCPKPWFSQIITGSYIQKGSNHIEPQCKIVLLLGALRARFVPHHSFEGIVGALQVPI